MEQLSGDALRALIIAGLVQGPHNSAAEPSKSESEAPKPAPKVAAPTFEDVMASYRA